MEPKNSSTVPTLTIAYRGTHYAGWQRQPNAVTVQQRIEEALFKLLGSAVRVVGAGRTDSGVHALGQVAHVVGVTEGSPGSSLPESALIHGTNRNLPNDIRVVGAQRMRAGFHARKSALSKRYVYSLVRTDVLSPLDALFAARVDPRIDLNAMRAACEFFVGEHDFSAFALSGGAHRSPIRRVTSFEIRERGPRLRFEVDGAGFLRGMVRSMVGTVLEVGGGRREPAEIQRLVAGASRPEAGPTAPPQGLVLEFVNYSEDENA